jgi:membrane associated rhomboid family serine protease
MTSLNYDIQDKLKRLTAFEKIIVVNIGIYIIGWLVAVINNVPRERSLDWLAMPSDFWDVLLKPWSIISYGFTHVEFWHLFFNMVVLYFIGRSFSNLFNVKTSLNIYFLGIISGALAFLLVYNLFPQGLLKEANGLIGASAAVRALLIFLCAYMPKYEVRFVTWNIKLMYIGIALVVFDIPGLFSSNAGGSVAHFGGYILGFMYAYQLKKGIDIGKGFERIMDTISSWFKPKSRLKTVYKSKKKQKFAGHTKEEFGAYNHQKQIDIILDKISKSGYDGLTDEEKEFLFRAGKNQK